VTVLNQRLFEDLCAGRRRALSRAISWVECDAPEASALLEEVYAHAPQPWVIGITGVGGAGKSSLVPHLARRLAAGGDAVAVLAVDPTSPITGGALLGDRLRDSNGQQDPNVFFRSVATRGGQGGLATCVADLVRVAAAAGCKTVIVETVGAGQSELGILQVAHSIVLVAAPGLGDDVQAQKAGVMEVANVMVVNKADRPGAQDVQASLSQALQLSEKTAHLTEGVNEIAGDLPVWHPPVTTTIAIKDQGIDTLCTWLHAHRDFLDQTGRFEKLNQEHVLRRMQAYFNEVVQRRLRERTDQLGLDQRLRSQLAQDKADPLAIARQLADAVLASPLASPQVNEFRQ